MAVQPTFYTHPLFQLEKLLHLAQASATVHQDVDQNTRNMLEILLPGLLRTQKHVWTCME
jgi:hypothetical protein